MPTDQNSELVATQSPEHITRLQQSPNAVGEEFEDLIPDLVAEGVIDFLEAVQVEDQRAEFALRFRFAIESRDDRLVKAPSVDSAGKRVAQSESFDLGIEQRIPQNRCQLRGIALSQDSVIGNKRPCSTGATVKPQNT